MISRASRFLVFALPLAISASPASADEFLSHPELLQADPRFPGDLVYFADDALQRLPGYRHIMVDEPEIFIAPDSPYQGIKPSDLKAVADLMRQSFSTGLAEEPTRSEALDVVQQAGPDTLYLRMAIKNVYVRKNKRGLLSFTPVGAVVKGVSDATKETMDKTTLIQMEVEAEVLDSQSGELLFEVRIERGHRKDKSSHTDEDAAGWEATGKVAELAGRRMACRIDNGRLPADQRRDCVKEIPITLDDLQKAE